jgi:hypothetical protein
MTWEWWDHSGDSWLVFVDVPAKVGIAPGVGIRRTGHFEASMEWVRKEKDR